MYRAPVPDPHKKKRRPASIWHPKWSAS